MTARSVPIIERITAACRRHDGRLTRREQISFFKRLSFLLRSGMTVNECIDALERNAKRRGERLFYAALREDVMRGAELHTALLRADPSLDGLAIALVDVGEKSGTLEESVMHIAAELEKRESFRKKVAAASAYPLFVMGMTAAVTAFIVLFVFPKVLPLAAALHLDLPLATRIILGISDILRAYGIALTLGCFLGVALAAGAVRRENIRRGLDRLLLRIPLIRSFVIAYNTYFIARSMGLLLASHAPLDASVRQTAHALSHSAYREMMLEAERGVRSGKQLSGQFETSRAPFPPAAVQMIAVGERAGNLASSFLHVAALQEEEMEGSVRMFSQCIEPALLSFVGLLVGFVVLATVTPIYSVTQHIYPR